MKLKNAGKFALNGITMTVAALLMRSAIMAFNSYVARTVGAEAVGLYSLLSGIYGFALTLALSGISLAVTRLVAENLALGNFSCVVKALSRSFVLSLLFGSFASFSLFFISETLASAWIHDLRIVSPLKILSLTLPMTAVSSVMNGYFVAVKRVYKNALAQFCEIAVKMSSTVILFTVIAKRDAATACILLASNSVIAEFASLAFNIIAYTIDRKRHINARSSLPCRTNATKQILEISMPVALTTYFRSALVSIEHSLIPKGLVKHGSDTSGALSAYGTLGSMALTVVNFPYALIGSFSSLLIPEITESRVTGKKRHIQYLSFRTYQFSSAFAFCMAGLLFEFSGDLGTGLYASPLAGEYIKHLSFLVPVMYTDTVTDSLLKGMGEQLYSMKVNIADALISVTLVYFLVPMYGIYGYIITIYLAELINAALSIAKAAKVCNLKRDIIYLYFKAAIASIGAVSIKRILTLYFGSSLMISLCIYIAIYFAIVYAMGIFSRDDWRWLRGLFKKIQE